MRVGDMKIEAYPTLRSNFLQKIKEANEGKRILSLHPEYVKVKQDKDLKSSQDTNITILYTYIADCILKENPLLKDFYQKTWNDYKRMNPDNGNPYSLTSRRFLSKYEDVLKELEQPGIIEREQETQRKMFEKEEQERIRESKQKQLNKQAHPEWESMQREQAFMEGKGAICPYCKSADTKKISTLSRAASVSLVGVASGKIGKQWHCNHCGSDF